jgi:hypothetical protein
MGDEVNKGDGGERRTLFSLITRHLSLITVHCKNTVCVPHTQAITRHCSLLKPHSSGLLEQFGLMIEPVLEFEKYHQMAQYKFGC